MRFVKDLLFWLLWGPVRRVFALLPLPAALALGRLLARTQARLPSGARSAMERAARVVLGADAPQASVRAAARRAVFNLVMNETEALLFPRMSPDNLALFVEIRGLDRLDAALAQGRGVVLAVAHFGANQMVMAAVGHSGRRLCQVSAPAPVLDDKMPGRRSRLFRAALETRWKHERCLPATHIDVFGPLTGAVECLRRGDILAVAVDGGHGASLTPAPFLGRAARLSAGALELAAHARCPVLPVFVVRGRDGRNTLFVEAPLPWLQTPDATRRDQAQAALAAYAPILERYVRAHPCHYLRYLAFRELMAATGEEPFFAA